MSYFFLGEEMSYFFLVYLDIAFSLVLFVFIFSNVIVCLCSFVISLRRFVACAWFYSTC